MYKNSRLSTKALLLAVGTVFAAPSVMADTVSADYNSIPGSGLDAATIAAFDTFDFGNGLGVLSDNGNGTFTGFYATYVTGHQLNGSTLNMPQLDVSGGLNFSGTGNGFELTMVSSFVGAYTTNQFGSLNFDILGGTAQMYFDTNPNYSFGNFGTFADGVKIMEGNLTSGHGTLLTAFNFGVSELTFDFGPVLNAPFDPAILAGTALFTMRGIGPGLFSSDGSLTLVAAPVPVPAAAWLMGSALLGLVSVGRRKAA